MSADQVEAKTRTDTVIGLVGAASLFGLGDHVRVSALIERVQDARARAGCLVFFPGEVEGNTSAFSALATAGTTSQPSSLPERSELSWPSRTVKCSRSTLPRETSRTSGVAKVRNPEDAGDWATLEWELRSFVCEGEYERGLDRILDQFLTHLSQDEQPAVVGERVLRQRQVAPDARTRVPLARLHAAVGCVGSRT